MDFWVPMTLLFLTAMIVTIFSKRRRDRCLKFLNRRNVYIRQQKGPWVWGTLKVFPNALDLNYITPGPPEDGIRKESYIFYQPHLAELSRILCPSPQPGTPERSRWERAVRRIAEPSILRRTARMIRNLFNTLRDAFSQSAALLIGSVNKKTRMGQIHAADQRAGEISRALMDAVPHAYEPALEGYLSRLTVVEELENGKVLEFRGILQEYTEKYLLLRNVPRSEKLLDGYEGPDIRADSFDVVFPRSCTLIRHRASESPCTEKPHE